MKVLWRTLALYAGAWTLTLAALVIWEFRSRHTALEDLMYLKAEILHDNTWALQHWVGGHGGVYVEVPADYQPSPLLAMQPEHRVVTPRGRHLALANTTVLMEGITDQSAAQRNARIRLTSQDPLNPDHQPAEWERKGLEALAAGQLSWTELIDESAQQAYRFMRPLQLQENCLSCHQYADADAGDVVGAISVHLDVSEDFAVHGKAERVMFLSYGAIWLVGLAGLTMTGRRWKGLLHALRQAATCDPLTGLWNRRELMRKLEHEMARSARYGHPLAVIMLDIDHFKRVNDSHGHQAGDQVLKDLAGLIQATVRGSDLVARYGGEEILVLCPETDGVVAGQLAERIRRHVEGATIVTTSARIQMTVSLGVAAYPELPTGTDLIQAADAAMYRAKQSGRNRVCSAAAPVG
ncbi:MAG TPA: diguanylate cyclase [Gammaproteobacteria bacterium]|nr:diguanylate cyclase [Gammaproteobacteria bacterium]